MKRCFFILISMLIISCSPQKRLTTNSDNETSSQGKPKAKSSEEIISELKQRLDSLIEKMSESSIADTKNVFDSTMNNGALGDVKYSVLPPNEFYKINGDCWHLLDSSSFVGTDLYRKTRSTGLGDRLPDGRGVFVRGIMTDTSKQAKQRGDPDGKRVVGAYQQDTIRSHYHNINVRLTGDDPNKEQWVRGGSKANDTQYPKSKSEVYGGDETRPKNIALYIYIRVSYLCN